MTSTVPIREKNRVHHVPRRYIPIGITRKDRQRVQSYLRKSRRLYKKGVYYTRPTISSFHSKPSKHVAKALKKYHLKTMKPNREMVRKTGCSLKALKKIVNKGEGAYYSSGSRPNQTPQSWGYARLASALTGGPALKVDYKILEEGCDGRRLWRRRL